MMMESWRHVTRAFTAAVGLVVGMALPGESLAQGVLVEARETGQGYLRARGTECYVLTPFHVVESAAGPIRIVSERAVRATAELLRQLPGDLALLRINDGAGLACGELRLPENFDAQMRGQTSGTLTTREADGSRSLMSVLFEAIDDEFIFVHPTRAGDQIRKSMSGASLVIAGAPVGLLLSVENGVGRVYQLDDVLRVSDGFFAPARSGTLSREELAELVGDYNAGSLMMHVGVGNDGALQVAAGNAGGSPGTLRHQRGLRFSFVEAPGIEMEFRRNAKGEVIDFVTYQPNGKPVAIRQGKVTPARGFLESLIGEYRVGDATFLIGRAAGGNLTFTVKGNPGVEIVHVRDATFVALGVTGTYFEFELAANGTVLGLWVRTADGGSLATRVRTQ